MRSLKTLIQKCGRVIHPNTRHLQGCTPVNSSSSLDETSLPYRSRPHPRDISTLLIILPATLLQAASAAPRTVAVTGFPRSSSLLLEDMSNAYLDPTSATLLATSHENPCTSIQYARNYAYRQPISVSNLIHTVVPYAFRYTSRRAGPSHARGDPCGLLSQGLGVSKIARVTSRGDGTEGTTYFPICFALLGWRALTSIQPQTKGTESEIQLVQEGKTTF